MGRGAHDPRCVNGDGEQNSHPCVGPWALSDVRGWRGELPLWGRERVRPPHSSLLLCGPSLHRRCLHSGAAHRAINLAVSVVTAARVRSLKPGTPWNPRSDAARSTRGLHPILRQAQRDRRKRTRPLSESGGALWHRTWTSVYPDLYGVSPVFRMVGFPTPSLG